ncbi:MAG: type II secretion system protein N [Ramlibacter sp.]
MARAPVSSRQRSPWAWAWSGGAIGLLTALVLFAPARWLASVVEAGAGGRIVLDEPRGTVWNGSAQLLLAGGPGSTDAMALPTRVDWRLRPRWDGAHLELSSACCTPQPLAVRARVRWGGAQVDIADAPSEWPAALLAGLGTPWNTLQIEGDLHLATRGLSVEWVQGRLSVAGRAELMAQRLSSRLSTLRPMGSYRITVLGGNTPTLQLDTLEGSLQLRGSGQWVGSRLRFSGEATAAPEREGALSNLLNIIGRRSGPRSIITIG